MSAADMRILGIGGVGIAGIASFLPENSEDNFVRCRELYADPVKAESVVKTTGIRARRIAGEGVSSLDLCLKATGRLFESVAVDKRDLAAVVSVTFTPERIMPGSAFQAQKRLGLSEDVLAFDLNHACSGWVYGLYLAAMLVRQTGRKVLLLDGDVQSRHLAPDDPATVPVLADAGTATLLAPDPDAPDWRFAFLTRGDGGEALTLPVGGTISMDGFAVYRFVAGEVVRFVKDFFAATGTTSADYDAFVPHQANVYMIRQLAKTLGFPSERLMVSADELGNSASATIPVTISRGGFTSGENRRLLVAGYGAGLSAAVADIRFAGPCIGSGE